MSVAENFKLVQDRVAAAAKRAGRNPSAISLVAVSKTVAPDRIREAVAAGATILGENRVQEARDKIEQLGSIASWHLIGRLQSNKAKYAVRLFDLIHSVDSIELAAELDRQAAKIGKVQDILVEVSIAGEEAKAGVAKSETLALVRQAALYRNLRIRGLMTMPPYNENGEAGRPYFRELRDLAAAIAGERIPGVTMNELTMGMSNDFEIAVEEGATLVRVGNAIFGSRR